MKAIENGAVTLFDIISKSYADVDTKLWIPASSNVRLHVDYLAYQDKLPKVLLLLSSCLYFYFMNWHGIYMQPKMQTPHLIA